MTVEISGTKTRIIVVSLLNNSLVVIYWAECSVDLTLNYNKFIEGQRNESISKYDKNQQLRSRYSMYANYQSILYAAL